MTKTYLAMVAVFVVMILVAVIASAGGDPQYPDRNPPGKTSVFEVSVEGREITCIYQHTTMGGGLSCDWVSD